jgi:anti-sigma factor RsiW
MPHFAKNGAECERAGALASLALDGQASEVEEAWVGAHLRVCADCERRVADMRSQTQALRAAPLVQPEHRVVVPARLGRPGRARQLAARVALAATLALAAAGLGVLAGSVGREPPPASPAGPEIALLDERRELRDVRRTKSPAPVEREAPRVRGV